MTADLTATTTHVYRSVDVPVDGGLLHAGVWEPLGPTGAGAVGTVLAIHGVTAHHLAFCELAARLPGVRVVAPDLRGRGRSNVLPGPYGMPRHADDVAALAAALGVRRAVVVGHSMGGFVSVVLAHRHPVLVERLVLVDGGLPLALPAGVDLDAAMAAVLGPAAQRLSMTFADHEAYRAFWRAHPAFTADWTERLGAYFDHDVDPVPGGLRPAARIEALSEDQAELFTGVSLLPALEALAVPTTFLRAPAGLLGAEPLYAPGHVAGWSERLPRLEVHDVPGVNHYTVVMAPHGAAAVADHVRRPGGGAVDDGGRFASGRRDDENAQQHPEQRRSVVRHPSTEPETPHTVDLTSEVDR
ncbi:alpha/beta fold hydrolase [Actinotalea sp. Marseille-Q4924]|uniref:alpha/beta fold hydrolase n=1 Tax=Actinotalea sp. Marseille-Q4924 TaxID=2866571 RepID=UPI001CE418A2|nr:alpha/beta hydrolase [Actinotalea sp. Marseille-Q4924]